MNPLLTLLLPHLRPLVHYGGILALIVAGYFCVVAPFIRLEEKRIAHQANQKPTIAFSAPTPSSKAAEAADVAARALSSAAMASAVAGQAIQLSAAQQAVQGVISSVSGLNNQLSSALAAGLTSAPPKVQTIEVGTQVKTKVSPPPAIASDDAIKKDLKEVLSSTDLHTTVSTDVHVRWDERPFAPVFAVYTSVGSGAGYVIHKSSYANLDALLLKQNGGHLGIGAGVDHVFKGTSASIGIGAVYDTGTKRVTPQVFAGVHF